MTRRLSHVYVDFKKREGKQRFDIRVEDRDDARIVNIHTPANADLPLIFIDDHPARAGRVGER
jgi:hypothetical protein